MKRIFLALTLFGLSSAMLSHAGEKTAKVPKGFAVEEQPKDDKAAKIVFIAGSNFFKPGEHEYIGGCALLMDMVKQSPNVASVLALDWPKSDKTFAGARAIVFFADGAEKHPVLKGENASQLQKLVDASVGLVMLHQGVDIPKERGDQMRSWMGAAWEKGHSQRAHWIDTYDFFPDHAITRGVKPFKIDDGYLYKLKFQPEMKGVTPILRTVNPKTLNAKRDDTSIVAWTYERKDGGRSFAFTGGHLHVSFAEAGYRQLLTNAILWTAKLDVPQFGARSELQQTELNNYLDGRGVGKTTK